MPGKPWTPHETAYMQARYPHTTTEAIAVSLGRTEKSVYEQAKVMKLRKTDEYLSTQQSGRIHSQFHGGRLHQFKPGTVPPNKGKRWEEWMPAEAREASLRTAFKKGNLPHNTRQDGEISIRLDKKGRPYRFIRVGLGKWKMLHVCLWEEHNGPVPKGWIVVFRDKDVTNITIENLECISRRENMLRNSYHNYGPEVAKAVQMIGALNRQINKKAKQHE